MIRELALEPDGRPVVRPFRSDEGRLVFRYLTIRPGGMAVWLEVPEGVLSAAGPKTEPSLERRLREAALALARSVTAGEGERRETADALREQNEALGSELEAARQRIAELERAASGTGVIPEAGPAAPEPKPEPALTSGGQRPRQQRPRRQAA